MTSIEYIEAVYKKANRKYNNDPALREKVHNMVLRIQNKDPEIMPLYFAIRLIGTTEAIKTYERLGVNLTLNDIRGESFFAGIPPVSPAEVKFCRQIQTENGLEDCER